MCSDEVALELEVDERAAIRAHELVNHEYDECRGEHHQRYGLRGEHDAVAALELLGNPVDEHACDEHQDDVDVFPGDGSQVVPFPGGSHLVDHVLGRVPGHFVGFCRVQVRACAEEKAGEGDEHEGKGHVPGGVEPVEGLLAEQPENHDAVDAEEQNAEPYGGNGADRSVQVLVDDGADGKE